LELKATRVERDGHVATVFLHRPDRHNAWTGRMHAEYRWLLAELDADPEVRAIVVTGTPPAFCVGGDSDALAGHAERGSYADGLPEEVATPGGDGRPELLSDLVYQWAMRVPLIAAVNGACAGIGLALVAWCDLRFVSATAKLTTAAPRLGLPAEYGLSWILPRLVGVTRANDLLLSGRIVTGAETAPWGLWNDVLPDGAATLEAAQRYAAMLVSTAAPSSVVATKRQVVDDLLSTDPAGSVEISKRLINAMTGSADYREGVAALREKRPPQF
jgi:enoyl-CoA hydratase/carnithine racemase